MTARLTTAVWRQVEVLEEMVFARPEEPVDGMEGVPGCPSDPPAQRETGDAA